MARLAKLSIALQSHAGEGVCFAHSARTLLAKRQQAQERVARRCSNP
jgi:hypothetical protein